jgi:hypothetical protein
VASPKRHNIENMEKYKTREFVDSLVSLISSSLCFMYPKSVTIDSERSSSLLSSTSNGFNLAASSSCNKNGDVSQPNFSLFFANRRYGI